MSSRERYEDVALRLELLRASHGEPEQKPEAGADLEPSWGPVGSLARAHVDPTVFAYLLAQHNQMLALERQRKAHADDPQVLHTG